MAVVVVTGCSSGFGEAIALGFAARGDAVAATMRRPEEASGPLLAAKTIECLPLDVTDAASRDSLIQRVLQRHGRIDVLVNNAGQTLFASVEDASEAATRRLFDVNYFGAVAMMRAVLPSMRNQGAGRIVNVSAMGAILSTALLGTYCATKHALDAISAAADLEVRPFGVRVSSVLPGQFKTQIAAKSLPAEFSAHYSAINDSLVRHRREHSQDFLETYDQVVDAVMAAASDPDPRPRYLAGVGLVRRLDAVIAELDRLHSSEAARAGVAG